MVQIKNNQKREGIESLVRANQLDPNDVNCLVKLGEIFSREESKQDQAIKFLKKALSLNDVLPEAHLTLGRIYDKQQDDELAIEQFKVAIKQSLNTQFQKVNM